MDKISVIMPCFNAEAHIARSIASVLDQSFKDIELLVIDDGSTDKSPGIVRAIKDRRLRVFTQENRGVSTARNRGLAEASGNYIAFLDADDTWDATCLAKLHGVLQAEANAALAYCGWQNVGLPGGQGVPYVPPDYEGGDKLEHLLKSCPWPIHAVLVRKEVIDGVGRFDEHLTNAEDYKLWLRIAAVNRIVRVPEVLAFYHFHGGTQASRNRAQAAHDHWKVQVEFLRENPAVAKQLGGSHVRKLVNGYLLRSGYECYWSRDIESARKIFRMVMRTGYGSFRDWKYMVPALLPLSMHRFLIHWHKANAAND